MHLVLLRLFSALAVMLGVSIIVFLFIHLIPGDPVEVILGETARLSDREALREALGLNQPIMTQWFSYMSGLLKGDLGLSLYSRQPVTDLIVQRLPASAELSFAAIFVGIALAIPLGIWSAMYKGKFWDMATSSFMLLGIAIPNFVFGPVLVLIFSLWLGWLPVSGRSGLLSLVLPAITLGTVMAAILARMLRSSLLEVLSEDYIRSARARGLSPLRVMFHHALRNAMLPMITLLGLQLGGLLAGAVITETVFDWPGIGRLTIEAIQRRDYPLLQGCILFISAVYVGVNMLTDILYQYIDPRIRCAA